MARATSSGDRTPPGRGPASAGRGGRPSPSGAPKSAAAPERRRTQRAPSPPPPEPDRGGGAGLIGGLGGLLRGSSSVFGQISGIENPARSLDRLAAAAERGALLIDRLDDEIGIERAIETLERLEHVVDLVEGMHHSLHVLEDAARDISAMRRSMHEIEERIVDLHARIAPPLDRLPLTRGLRRRRPPEPAGS